VSSRLQLSMGLRSFSPSDPGGWESLVEQIEILEAAGIDRAAVSDHVVFGDSLEDYGRPELGGAASGMQPTGPDGHWLEPLTTLAFLAGKTTSIRLATGILLAALRRPVVLAKSAATLDVLSGGRLDLGVGVGWQRAEYDSAGLEFSQRGRLLDHTLEVCQTLWREPWASYETEELAFEGIHMEPKPLQPGGVPIWVSGTVNPRVVQRLARFGVGWIPWGPAAADPVAAIEQMKSALLAAGADPQGLQVMGALPVVRDEGGRLDARQTAKHVPRLAAAGVTDFRISTPLSPDRAAALDDLTALVDAFRRVAESADTP
jgi:probable F420-dependent oxidoreductase